MENQEILIEQDHQDLQQLQIQVKKIQKMKNTFLNQKKEIQQLSLIVQELKNQNMILRKKEDNSLQQNEHDVILNKDSKEKNKEVDKQKKKKKKDMCQKCYIQIQNSNSKKKQIQMTLKVNSNNNTNIKQKNCLNCQNCYSKNINSKQKQKSTKEKDTHASDFYHSQYKSHQCQNSQGSKTIMVCANHNSHNQCRNSYENCSPKNIKNQKTQEYFYKNYQNNKKKDFLYENENQIGYQRLLSPQPYHFQNTRKGSSYNLSYNNNINDLNNKNFIKKFQLNNNNHTMRQRRNIGNFYSSRNCNLINNNNIQNQNLNLRILQLQQNNLKNQISSQDALHKQVRNNLINSFVQDLQTQIQQKNYQLLRQKEINKNSKLQMIQLRQQFQRLKIFYEQKLSKINSLEQQNCILKEQLKKQHQQKAFLRQQIQLKKQQLLYEKQRNFRSISDKNGYQMMISDFNYGFDDELNRMDEIYANLARRINIKKY